MRRTVLVTGGTSGIGRAIAQAFAADGADVTITGRNAVSVEKAAADLGVRGVVCDATDPDQVSRLAAQFSSGLDVAACIAGSRQEPVEGDTALRRELAEWNSSLAQNLLGTVLTVTAVRDQLRPGGAIISMGSIGAERRGGSYGAAKAALGAWNQFVSAELGPRDITANVIAAGYIADTNFFGGDLTDAYRQRLIEETHNKRAGTTDDIAATVLFLASPGGRHITGQTIHVNGGAHTTR